MQIHLILTICRSHVCELGYLVKWINNPNACGTFMGGHTQNWEEFESPDAHTPS